MITVFMAEGHDTQGNITHQQTYWAYEEVDGFGGQPVAPVAVPADPVEPVVESNQAQPNPSQGLYRQWKW